MTPSAALDTQVQEEQERHQLLEQLASRSIQVDPALSLEGLREIAADATPGPDPDGKKLFNDADYEREDLAIAKVDGNQVDRIAIKFAGEVFLDRSNPNDVALYNKLSLGNEFTLMIEGRCNATGAKGATDREGDLDVVVGSKAVKVTTVYIPALAEDDSDA